MATIRNLFISHIPFDIAAVVLPPYVFPFEKKGEFHNGSIQPFLA